MLANLGAYSYVCTLLNHKGFVKTATQYAYYKIAFAAFVSTNKYKWGLT